MFRLPLLCSIVFSSFVVLSVASVPVSAETIEGALAKAYTNNPDFNAQRAAVRATDEGVQRARAGQLPSIRTICDAEPV